MMVRDDARKTAAQRATVQSEADERALEECSETVGHWESVGVIGDNYT